MRTAANARRSSASLPAASAAASQAWYIGGAPGTAVTCSSAMSASDPRGSNVSSSTAQAPGGGDQPEAGVEAVDVEQRQDEQHPVVLAHRRRRHGQALLLVGPQRRRRSGSRRAGGRSSRWCSRGRPARRGRRRTSGGGPSASGGPAQTGTPATGVPVGGDDEQRGTGVGEHVLELGIGVGGVHRDDDQPGAQRAERGPQPGQPVGQLDGDAVARGQPRAPRTPRRRGRPRRPARPRSAACSPGDDRRRVRAAAGPPPAPATPATYLPRSLTSPPLELLRTARPGDARIGCIRARWRGRAGAMLSPWGQPRSMRARRPAGARREQTVQVWRADEEVDRPHAAPPGRRAAGRRAAAGAGPDARPRTPVAPAPAPRPAADAVPRASTEAVAAPTAEPAVEEAVDELARGPELTPASPATRRVGRLGAGPARPGRRRRGVRRALRPLRDDGPPVRLPPGRRPGDGRGRHQRDLRAGAAPDRLAVLPGPRRRAPGWSRSPATSSATT